MRDQRDALVDRQRRAAVVTDRRQRVVGRDVEARFAGVDGADQVSATGRQVHGLDRLKPRELLRREHREKASLVAAAHEGDRPARGHERPADDDDEAEAPVLQVAAGIKRCRPFAQRLQESDVLGLIHAGRARITALQQRRNLAIELGLGRAARCVRRRGEQRPPRLGVLLPRARGTLANGPLACTVSGHVSSLPGRDPTHRDLESRDRQTAVPRRRPLLRLHRPGVGRSRLKRMRRELRRALESSWRGATTSVKPQIVSGSAASPKLAPEPGGLRCSGPL